MSNGKMKRCGKPIKPAKNGVDRGVCTKPPGHKNHHGNGTCPLCGIKLTSRNTSPSHFRRGSGMCRKCSLACLQKSRRLRNVSPRNFQVRGQLYTFICGCSVVLPEHSNRFVIVRKPHKPHRSHKSSECRVSQILSTSNNSARKYGYTSIEPSTPHHAIHKMMEEPLCWRCRKPLGWDLAIEKGETPHLHHNHDTGEIYGFVHPRCNSKALEHEIDELKDRIREQEARILE